MSVKKGFKTVAKINLPLCSEVDSARKYLENRKLDASKFYYADKFKEFCNSYKKTYDTIGRDEPRIVIPLYQNDNLIGFQGRAIEKKSVPKYLTVMINEEAPKIYGFDTINKKLPVYVVEGPFDSTLVSNSIAMCGADADVRKWGVTDPIWIYDNEPRNHEIVKRISTTIDRGERVVIWPNNIHEKDINDMVLSGHNIMNVLESNTHTGLQAKIKFNNWKKV